MHQQDESATIAAIESTMLDVKCWMDSVHMKMNESKTEFIYFGSKQMLKKCSMNTVNINGEHIARSGKVKYLGGFLDSTLSFCQHVIAKCHATNISLQKIRHIRKFLTKDTCQQLIQSCVMSYLDYANAMLSGIPKTLINIMQCTQNQAARITIGKAKIRHDSATEIRRSLHWLPIRERRYYKITTYIYKCQNNQAPMYLQKLITGKKVKQPGLHSSNIKQIPTGSSIYQKTHIADRSFSVYGPKLWNTLPNSVKESKAIDTFKGKLKTYLFSKAYN